MHSNHDAKHRWCFRRRDDFLAHHLDPSLTAPCRIGTAAPDPLQLDLRHPVFCCQQRDGLVAQHPVAGGHQADRAYRCGHRDGHDGKRNQYFDEGEA